MNAADRTIRLVTVLKQDGTQTLHVQLKLHNAIIKHQWVQCGFSANGNSSYSSYVISYSVASGDYILAGASYSNNHSIYIYDKTDAHLVSLLEGPKNGLLGVVVTHILIFASGIR